MQIFNSKDLSNEQYRELPQVSASTLVRLWQDCPAQWRYGEPKASPALAEGIAAHVAILEPADWGARYYRDMSPADYPDSLVTIADINAWLKGRGIKGYSGKVKTELVQMVLAADPDAQIYDVMVEELAAKNEGKEALKPDVYDMIEQMRNVIRADADYNAALTGAQFEVSLVDKITKCRIDCITAGGEIWDYKTTTTAHPDAFAKQAHDNGYWLKMAYQHDLYELAYGKPPGRVVLLAQSKKKPYIPQAYALTPEQLEIGRDQYTAALRLYERCNQSNCWPAYGGGVQELPTPAWLARSYGLESDIAMSVEVEGDQDPTENNQTATN